MLRSSTRLSAVLVAVVASLAVTARAQPTGGPMELPPAAAAPMAPMPAPIAPMPEPLAPPPAMAAPPAMEPAPAMPDADDDRTTSQAPSSDDEQSSTPSAAPSDPPPQSSSGPAVADIAPTPPLTTGGRPNLIGILVLGLILAALIAAFVVWRRRR